MSKRRAAERGKQASNDPEALSLVMRQMVLPLIVGAEATKRGLLAFVQQMGMLALRELFDGEAEMIAGPKGKHVTGRTHHHWGTTRTPLPFGGRHVVVERPRVRRRGGGEEMLPSVVAFRAADPLSARVAEQIVLGVSTRGYAQSLDPLAEGMEARGASKSAASRALIDKTTEKLRSFGAGCGTTYIASSQKPGPARSESCSVCSTRCRRNEKINEPSCRHYWSVEWYRESHGP